MESYESPYDNLTVGIGYDYDPLEIWYENATGITINQGGVVHMGDLYEVFYLVNSTINAGGLLVLHVGCLENITINNQGILTTGGIISEEESKFPLESSKIVSVTINSGGYLQHGYGKAENIVVKTGGIYQAGYYDITPTYSLFGLQDKNVPISDQTIVDGGIFSNYWYTVTNTTVNAGTFNVHGGVAQSTIVNSSGVLNLYSFANTHHVRLQNYFWADPGVAQDTVLNGGRMYLSDNTCAANTRIEAGGRMFKNGNSTADGITVNADNALFLSSGAEARDIVINGGTAHVGTGGTVSDVTITSGNLCLYGGAILDGTINVNGTLVLDDVTLNYGQVNLQLAADADSQQLMIDNLSLLQGEVLIISADSLPTTGSYRLAGNASAYTDAITLTVNGEKAGDLVLNGKAISCQGQIYALTLDETSVMTQEVRAAYLTPPTISADVTTPTNQPVTVTALFPEASVIREYSFDGSLWLTYTSPVIMTESGTLYFRGTDSFGTTSEIAQYTVSNIDKTTPQITVRADNTEQETRDSVFVSAVFADNVELFSQEFSLNGTDWFAYASPIEMEKNGTVWFRAIDTAGNMAQTSYTVSNIAEGPAAPSGTTASLKKYNVTFSWNKYSAEKGVKVKYQVMTDGIIDPKLTTSTKYTLKNATVGDHSFAVRAVLSEKGKEDVYTEWSTDLIQYVTDVTAPKLGKVSAAISGYSGTISWSGSDNVGVEYYEVRCADQVQTVSGTSARFENLAVGKYKAEVIAYDAAGNASKTGKVSITVKDATPPEQVTGLAIPVVDSKYKAMLSWAPGVDNSGKVANYEIQLDDGKILKSSKNSLNVSKLAVGEHTYRVRAVDKEKNVGEWSELQTFTAKDMTAPSAVSAKATVEGNSLLLSWGTPKDNVGVTGYILKYGTSLENTEYLTADVLNYRIDGLPRGSYQYELTAVDAAGNESKPKTGKATIKTELPIAEFDLETPKMALLGDFDKEVGVVAASPELLDDPLAFCDTLRLDREWNLSASDLAGTEENAKRALPFLATGC